MSITKQDLLEALKNVATKDDLKRFATKDDLKAIKDDLKQFSTKDDLKAIKDDLKQFSTKDDLKAIKDDLKRFATKDDIKNLPTKAYVDTAVEKLDKKIDKSIHRLDEKIAIRLTKYFYTKDETDRKFVNIVNCMDKKFKEQMHQIKILFESLRANNLEFLHEKDQAQDEQLGNHEKRITGLETTL